MSATLHAPLKSVEHGVNTLWRSFSDKVYEYVHMHTHACTHTLPFCMYLYLSPPSALQVQANLESDHNEPNFGSYLIVACMLVREGAELHIKDINGESPFQLCSAEEAAVIKTHAQKYRYVHCGHFRFHGE